MIVTAVQNVHVCVVQWKGYVAVKCLIHLWYMTYQFI